jgi:anti-sigma B factor antagonist
MNIEKVLRPDHAILHLKGEFDTIYCPVLEREIDSLVDGGIQRVALNMRLTKFINSTALGAIVKARKRLSQAGGELVISHPSPFTRDVISKVGLDKIVRVFEDDRAAIAALSGTEPVEVDDEASVLFFFADEGRRKKFGRPVGVGRLVAVDENGLDFVVGGGETKIDVTAAASLLGSGTSLRVKFRLPLYKRHNFFEIPSTVDSSATNKDGTLRVRARFSEIRPEDRSAIRQFAEDMRFLKGELRDATGKA